MSVYGIYGNDPKLLLAISTDRDRARAHCKNWNAIMNSYRERRRLYESSLIAGYKTGELVTAVFDSIDKTKIELREARFPEHMEFTLDFGYDSSVFTYRIESTI